MRNKWLWAIIAGLQLLGLQRMAAEKPREWQTGQIVESKVQVDPRVHTIAGPDKTYLVRGTVAGEDDALAVGKTVRFAVEDKNVYLSITGKEYKLYLLGATAKVTPLIPAPAPSTPASAVAPAPPPVRASKAVAPPGPPDPAQPAAAPAPANALDNDAIVKMIVGGLKEDTVVSVIQSRPGAYNLNPDALSGLKAAGVPQNVIAAMTARMKAAR